MTYGCNGRTRQHDASQEHVEESGIATRTGRRQTERDHAALAAAAKNGRIQALVEDA